MTNRAIEHEGRGRGRARHRCGFTLIEMLVVIGVIGILAGMVVFLAPLAGQRSLDKRAEVELKQLISAIEAYKAKKGFYPPSNPTDETKPPLYYELKGTRRDPNTGMYQTLDRASSISEAEIKTAYGVGGFVNSTDAASSSDPDRPAAENFHTALKVTQTRPDATTPNAIYLGLPYEGPEDRDVKFTRWRYHLGEGDAPVSRRPKRNKEGYDLWIEVMRGGKTNVYGNWKK